MKPDALHPFISALLDQRGVWATGTKKPEALTSQLLLELHRKKLLHGPMSRAAAVFDWTALGCCTGSRISEYGQSGLKRNSQWNTIPDSDDVPPEWRGKPLAFIPDDFTFYTSDGVRLSDHEVILIPDKAAYIWIRFRYDKGKLNFIVRKFRRIPRHFLDPVDAGLSIRLRAIRLQLPRDAPLGAYAGQRKRVLYIKDDDMTKAFKDACLQAYPHPEHHMRLKIGHLSSHSIRVTAAVILDVAGVPLDDIKFRLRWISDSVKEYIRDVYRKVDELTIKALHGAWVHE